jgi:hypothetical protein
MAEGIAGAPPSWDETTPMEAAVQTAGPKASPPPRAAAPPPSAPTADAPAPASPAPADDAPPAWDDTAPVTPAAAAPTGPDPLPDPASNGALKKLVSHNVQVYNALNKGKAPVEAQGILDALQAGYQMSVTGLAARGGMPDEVLPEHAGMALRIANQIGTLAGDLPVMAASGFAATAATAGTVVGIPAAPVAGMAASFAVPAAMRKIMIDHYEKGDIKTSGEFAERAMATGWEATKGAITGAATAILGPAAGMAGEVLGKAGAPLVGDAVASVAGPAAKFLGDVSTMTTVGAGLEGHLPTSQDFIDGAIVMGGMHATTSLPGKFREIYAKTGEHPYEVAQAAETNVELKQQLLTEDPTSPPQAHPTDLTFPDKAEWDPPEPAEGETRAPMTPAEKEAAAQPRLEPQSQEIPEPEESEHDRTPEEQEVLSKIGEAPDAPKGTAKDAFNRFYAKNIDYLDPLAVAIAEAKTNGIEVPSEKNAYEQGRLFASHLDRVRSFVEVGTRDAKTGEINGEGLNQILRDVPPGKDGKPDLDGYRAYAMSARAIELDDRGINPWSDFSRQAAENVVEAGRDKYEEINRRRIDFENRVLQYAGDKGLFSEKQLEAMQLMNEQHIPFYRVMEPDTWTGKAQGGTAVKRIYGSDRSILDPLVSTYRNVEALIKRAEINDIRSSFVSSMENEAMMGKWIERDEQMVPTRVGENELSEHLQKQGIEVVPDELNPLTIFRPEKGLLKDNQFAIYRDGERLIYTGEPGVIDSLRRLDGNSTAMSAWTKTLAGFTKATRLGVTSDPGFAFRHFFRSQIMSGVYSQTGQIPFLHSALAMGEFMKGESDTYKNWVYDGGAVSSWDRLDENYLKNNLQGADKEAPFQEKAWNVIKKPLEASEAFIKMTDNLSRFTEYKRTLEQGGTRADAAFASREVTVDYQKQGLQRDALRAGVAFIGAHINSLDRMTQAFQEEPKGTVAKLAAISAISAMVWAVNKDDEAIQSLPNWQKDLYWNFRVPGASGDGKQAMIFRLPKPWAPGILFGSGVETALDAWKGTSPSRADDFAHSILTSVIPEPIPNMLGPIAEQWANKSLFSGRPLVSQDKEKLLPELQYSPYTSETAKQLAKLIGYVPYVSDIGPSSDKLASPAVVENYIQGWTGTLGGWALKISDAGLKALGIGPNHGENPATVADNPFMREFVSRYPSLREQPLQDFYNNLDKTSRVLDSQKYAGRHGDPALAARIAADYPDLEIKLTGINKGISTAKKVIQNIQDDPKMPAVEKRQLMDTMLFQVHSMAKMGNQMMKDFQKATGAPNEGTK